MSMTRGLFEFIVIPFSLSNDPAVFQEAMTEVFQGIVTFFLSY